MDGRHRSGNAVGIHPAPLERAVTREKGNPAQLQLRWVFFQEVILSKSIDAKRMPVAKAAVKSRLGAWLTVLRTRVGNGVAARKVAGQGCGSKGGSRRCVTRMCSGFWRRRRRR